MYHLAEVTKLRLNSCRLRSVLGLMDSLYYRQTMHACKQGCNSRIVVRTVLAHRYYIQVMKSYIELPKQLFDQLCVPPQLQPLNATLNQLQAQLDNLKPLLYGSNSNHVNAVLNPLEMASPTLAKTHHRANSYSDTGSRVFNNAFEVPMQSQNTATVTRSQVHDPTTVNGTAVNGRKQSTGSQLNPLAHAYSSMSGISANFDALNCLQSLTLGPMSGNRDTNTPAVVANGIGLGLGAPLFTHSGGSKSPNSTGAASAARQVKNFSNGTHNLLKPVSSAVAVSAGSGGRYGK